LALSIDLAPFTSYFKGSFSFPLARLLHDDKYHSRHYVPSSGQTHARKKFQSLAECFKTCSNIKTSLLEQLTFNVRHYGLPGCGLRLLTLQVTGLWTRFNYWWNCLFTAQQQLRFEVFLAHFIASRYDYLSSFTKTPLAGVLDGSAVLYFMNWRQLML
jgi:hypothetical protein